MHLRYITCSDPREFNNIDDIVNLTQISPLVEIATQAHPSKMSQYMPRNKWFSLLLFESQNMPHPMNLALHVNNEWATQLCEGVVPYDLQEWFNLCHPDTFAPTIQRIQINMPKAAADSLNPDKLAKLISDFHDHEFIIQYNANTRRALSKLNRTGVKFSVLFDESGGKGIEPTKWQRLNYKNHPVGYAGGLYAGNVDYVLDKIATSSMNEFSWWNKDGKKDTPTWIDAEGKLKTDNKFNPKLAQEYILKALAWQKHNIR